MHVFKEEQKFNQWWVYAIVFFTGAGSTISIYNETDGFTNFKEAGPILFGLFLIGIMVYLFSLRLKTKISKVGIEANFRPLSLFKREYRWNEIASCHVRKYSAITEYGGWGIRGLFPTKAYTVRGSYGIQIVTKDNVHFLIGTQKPEKAKATVKRYTQKHEN